MLFVAGGGCATQPVPLADERMLAIGAAQGYSAEAICHGRQLYVTDCRYCHMPVVPESISMERWDKVLPRMIEKAQLSGADEADIRAYVIAARAMAGAAVR